MGKKKDDGDAWVAGLIILGGLWFLSQLLKPTKKIEYNRCWNCKRLVIPKTNPCPYCKVQLLWGSGNTIKVETTAFITRAICYGFFASLFIAGLSTFFAPDSLIIWTHLVIGLGGILGGHLTAIVSPPT